MVARSSVGGSRCCQSSASSAGICPVPAGRATGRAAPSAALRSPTGCSSRSSCPSRSSRPRRRRSRVTTSRSLPRRPPLSSVRSGSSSSSGQRSPCTASRPSTCSSTASSSRTPSSSWVSTTTARLVLGDEAFTPDSSRFWPAASYAPGGPQPSFDKQFARDWCEATGWDKTDPGPELPDDVVSGTRARYVEAFERLTQIAFDRYLADPEGGALKATVLIRPKGGILDPQGEAVRAALDNLGFPVAAARVGRARRPRVVDRQTFGRDASAGRADVRRAAGEPTHRERRDRAGRRASMSDRPLVAVSHVSGLERRRRRRARAGGRRRRGGAGVARRFTAPRSGRRCRAPRKVVVRRLPALRRNCAHGTRDGRRSRVCGRTAGRCSGSATASRSCASRGFSSWRASPQPPARVRVQGTSRWSSRPATAPLTSHL